MEGGGIPIFPSQHTHCKKCGVVITQRMCGYHTLSFHTWCVDTILCRTHAHTTHAECVANQHTVCLAHTSECGNYDIHNDDIILHRHIFETHLLS